jgi:hypothetical protein
MESVENLSIIVALGENLGSPSLSPAERIAGLLWYGHFSWSG